jgi:hypothetical protein
VVKARAGRADAVRVTAIRPCLIALSAASLAALAVAPALAAPATPGDLVGMKVDAGEPIRGRDWVVTVRLENAGTRPLSPVAVVLLRERGRPDVEQQHGVRFDELAPGDSASGRVTMTGADAGDRDLDVRIANDGRWIAADRTPVFIREARGIDHLQGNTLLVAAVISVLAAALSLRFTGLVRS